MPSQTQTIILYRNGDLNDNGFPLSFSHRKFSSIDQFVDYINDELQIAKKKHGYRNIFTPSGDEVTTMHDIEYGKTYVLALNRNFIKMDYSEESSTRNGRADSDDDDRKSRNRGSGSRQRSKSARTRTREDSDVKDDERQMANSYNKRREKARQRNMDRYPSRLKQRPASDYADRRRRSEDNRDESGGDDSGEDEIEVTVYRNGNYTDPGSYIEINKSQYRSSRFSQFITYINEQMYLLGLSAGIRHVYTLEGKEITKVDKLRNKGKYVIGAGRFMKLNYGENALYLKGRRRAATTPKTKKSRRRKRRENQDDDGGANHDRDIEVRVFENGNNTDPGQQVRVPKEKLEEFDDFFGHLKSNMKDKRGYRNLYSENGKAIRATRQVQDGDQLVIGTGRFINLRYGEHYRKMKRIREKVNRGKKEKRSSREQPKRSYSDGDMARSTRAESRAKSSDSSSNTSETQSSTDPYESDGYETVERKQSHNSNRSSSKDRNRNSSKDGNCNSSNDREGSKERDREKQKSRARSRARSQQKSRGSLRSGKRMTSRERSSLERKRRQRQRRHSY